MLAMQRKREASFDQLPCKESLARKLRTLAEFDMHTIAEAVGLDNAPK